MMKIISDEDHHLYRILPYEQTRTLSSGSSSSMMIWLGCIASAFPIFSRSRRSFEDEGKV